VNNGKWSNILGLIIMDSSSAVTELVKTWPMIVPELFAIQVELVIV
jgi:hypothetical protein